jgi:hypothetical protein
METQKTKTLYSN